MIEPRQDVFRAIVDPHRRQILQLLMSGERPVQDLPAPEGPAEGRPGSTSNCAIGDVSFVAVSRAPLGKNGAYHFLDLVPRGRDEDGLESPQEWVRHHDRYQD